MVAVAVLSLLLFGLCQANPPVFIDHGIEPGMAGCLDLDLQCSVWANRGECQSNFIYMMANCRRSCKSCQGGDRAWKLRTHIGKIYDDNSTVVNNFSIKSVAVESLRLDHVEVDEKAQLMKVHGKLTLSWNDSRIAWDTQKWGVSWLHFYWVQIWTPQVIQTNTPNAQPAPLIGKLLAANYTGKVFMWSDFSFTAPCPFDYSAYPSDKQRCCIKLDDKRYFAVRFHSSPTAVESARLSAESAHVSGWKVDDIEVKENKYTVEVLRDWTRDPYALETTNCDICVQLRRNAAYYSSEIVGPAVATAVITVSSFLVGGTWPQLCMVVASVAMQILSLAIVNSRLPPASGNAPSVVKFYSFNMAVTLLILISTILLNRLSSHRSTIPPPHLVDKFLALIHVFLPCMRGQLDDEEQLSPPDSAEKGKCHWAPLSNALKWLLFVIVLVLYVLVMLGCFAV